MIECGVGVVRHVGRDLVRVIRPLQDSIDFFTFLCYHDFILYEVIV